MNKTQVILFGSIGIVIVLAILLILGVIPGLKQNVSSASADMLLWDFGSSPEIWTQTIGVYKAANPNINITYVQKDPNRFEEELLNALASGKAPDIWTIKQSWILKHKDKIFPFPEVSLQFSKTDYQRLFADTSFSFIQDKQIIALPTSIDTLALFYNKDIFNSENIPNPPSTWDDMLAVVKKTTKRSAAGNIIQGGVAMGTIKNINHGVDVVSALLLQNGNSILDPESKTSDLGNQESSNAIEFYRSFSDSGKKNYSWSDEMPSSLNAFAEEKVSMAFGFSTDYPLIKAKNPRLNFAIAALPQQNDSTIKTNYGVTTGL
ncbi:MAG: extracellular solute-binding protein, partial [Patescibacteria group bacterium]